MDFKAQGMAPQGAEVSMLAPEIVRQIRGLRDLGWGAKRIAGETGVARGTVRRLRSARKTRFYEPAAPMYRP